MRNVDEIIAYHAKLREAGPIPAHRDVEGVLIVEVQRLRAELAAEKERAADMPIVLVDVLLSERERCAGIVEAHAGMKDKAYALLLAAAAIRASNAAPPQTEDRYHLRPEPADLDHFNREHYREEDAAPPHVEPAK